MFKMMLGAVLFRASFAIPSVTVPVGDDPLRSVLSGRLPAVPLHHRTDGSSGRGHVPPDSFLPAALTT